MANSKTSLANKALTLCGAAAITNITDDTPNARTVNRVYAIARQGILSECNWNFAKTRATLSLSAVTQPWDHDDEAYVYVRPANVLTIVETNDKYAIYREEGDYIMSDTANLGIKYIYDIDDPAKYPPKFVDAFVDRLCAEIAFQIVNSKTLAQEYLEKYEKISLPKAMARNSQQGTQVEQVDDAWENAKYHNDHPAA